MAQYKTPGVYIVEKNAFPNSVVEVATAVPAFIGYTETAARDKTDLINIPTRISSLAEFDRYFGGPPKALFTIDEKDGGKLVPVPATLFLLYRSMRLFFDNGGGPCWIVSIGRYEGAKGTPIAKKAKDFDSAWPALAKEAEPTMIVVPDAVLLSAQDWKTIANTAPQHCVDLGSRIAILDIFDGDKARTNDADDVISGDTGFRRSVNSASPSYAVAYYPWLNTSIVEAKDIDYTNLDAASRKTLADSITVSLKAQQEDGDDLPQPLIDLIGTLTVEDRPCKEIHETHQSLMTSSSDYKETMGEILKAINVIPPSGAMAGVYTRTDSNEGVFKAPANTGIVSVVSLTVNISHDDQEDLNLPLDGKAVNAIRAFPGLGILIWGARTLDGNSQDWRYVNVRRTLIMLEQSIKYAMAAYVFAPNADATWVTVKGMVDNFLTNQWKAGALAGSNSSDAFSIDIGLGKTMTANDILEGTMRMEVKVAVTRPAEFIVLTFQQEMQTS